MTRSRSRRESAGLAMGGAASLPAHWTAMCLRPCLSQSACAPRPLAHPWRRNRSRAPLAARRAAWRMSVCGAPSVRRSDKFHDIASPGDWSAPPRAPRPRCSGRGTGERQPAAVHVRPRVRDLLRELRGHRGRSCPPRAASTACWRTTCAASTPGRRATARSTAPPTRWTRGRQAPYLSTSWSSCKLCCTPSPMRSTRQRLCSPTTAAAVYGPSCAAPPCISLPRAADEPVCHRSHWRLTSTSPLC